MCLLSTVRPSQGHFANNVLIDTILGLMAPVLRSTAYVRSMILKLAVVWAAIMDTVFLLIKRVLLSTIKMELWALISFLQREIAQDQTSFAKILDPNQIVWTVFLDTSWTALQPNARQCPFFAHKITSCHQENAYLVTVKLTRYKMAFVLYRFLVKISIAFFIRILTA